jgi:HD-like signal output (HDOD) protein
MFSFKRAEIAIPDRIRERLSSRAEDLNMLPAVAAQALQIANEPDCSITRFAGVVERDVKLTADILKLANSSMYSPTAKIVNLHQAVSRLGFRKVQNLILTSSVTALMRRMSIAHESIRDQLWRHGFLTATLALHLNRSLGAGFEGEEFTVGLMHDIGRTLFAVICPDEFCEIDPLDFVESLGTLEQERGVVQTDHCDLGGWFAESNNLPRPIVEVIHWHHNPVKSSANRRLVALISAADHMANYLQRQDFLGDEYDAKSNHAVEILESTGIRRAMAKFRETATPLMKTADEEALVMMAL